MKTSFISVSIAVLLITVSACQQGKSPDSSFNNAEQLFQEGDSITSATFVAIRTALMKAIEAGGIENAIAYCNAAAMPITDSLSRQYSVKISRISDKVRNPLNKASAEELELIQSYRNKGREGAMIVTDNENKLYYKPIIIQAFCLNCHGTVGEELTVANNELIKNYYPDDTATDYKEGDLRGLWKVVFAYK